MARKFNILVCEEVLSLLEVIFVNLLHGMHIKPKKTNIQMRKELTLEFTTPAYRSVILDKLLLISLISLLQCILIKLLTAASVNPSCFKESISYPHLIWAAVEMLNIMDGQHISSVNYLWNNCLVWPSFWTLWNTAAASAALLPLVLLKALVVFCFIHGSFWRREVAWVVRELYFSLRELSKSHKIF